MKLTMLGTGNAMVTGCYNTCFTLQEGEDTFLVDGGGGNQILSRLTEAGVDHRSISAIFVTHKHIDHLLGIIWMLRLITQDMTRGGPVRRVVLYSHDEVIGILNDLAHTLIEPKCADLIGKQLLLCPVEDGETRTILGHPVTFFDINSTKAKQFGFSMEYAPGKKLTCCGDEPCSPHGEEYARGSEWLLHEAFCLDAQADLFHPYEKHHSTAKNAAELAERLGVKHLLLYHTEEKNLADRKALYTAEGKRHYSGELYVPDDLEALEVQ